jgi:hypothetical protein
MDERRFDAVARSIGTAATRRGALRAVAGMLIGAATGFSGRLARARTCRLVGEPCGKGKQSHCCAGAVCHEGEVGGNICSCPQNLTNCHGHCVDITSNPLACGAECVACPDETDCCNGACCKEGQRCCDGKCTDVRSDHDHCGECGTKCDANFTCCNGQCVNLLSADENCGGCGKSCGPQFACKGGQCVCRHPGEVDCHGVCVNLGKDVKNCGACGHACGIHTVCRAGRCRCAPHYSAVCHSGQCGRAGDQPCTRDDDCCSGQCVSIGGHRQCVPCQGMPCSATQRCCQGLPCEQSPGPDDTASFCGNCRGRRLSCTANEQCCSTDCTPDETGGSTCLSNRDGQCSSDNDCRECFVGGNCNFVCVNGRCRI